MEWLTHTINTIIVAALVYSMFEMLLPEGNLKPVVKLVLGLFMLLTIAGPLVQLITGDAKIEMDMAFETPVIEYSDNSYSDIVNGIYDRWR
jgi:stage III sporulation protein AF